jgi:hypothetical protein
MRSDTSSAAFERRQSKWSLIGDDQHYASKRISQEVYERCGAKYSRLSRGGPTGVVSTSPGLDRIGAGLAQSSHHYPTV